VDTAGTIDDAQMPGAEGPAKAFPKTQDTGSIYPKNSHDREEHLISQLRSESYQVKDCFTRHSFQAMAASCALLILIARFQVDNLEVGILSVLPIVLLFTVADMGMHKYATSNRLMGYELYLYRLHHYTSTEKLSSQLTAVGWEEAMQAWRVVHSNLFHNLYKRVLGKHWPHGWTPLKGAQKNNNWYCPKELLPDKEILIYKTGAYLQSIIVSLLTIVFLCLVDVGVAMKRCLDHSNLAFSIMLCGLFGLIVFLAATKTAHIISRINILENELYSIYACSIVWETAVLAHLLALISAQKDSDWAPKYMTQLGVQTAEIVKYRHNVPEWNAAKRKAFCEDDAYPKAPVSCCGSKP